MVIDSLFIDLCIYEIFASDNRSVKEALAAYNVSLHSGAYDGNSSLTELMFSDAMLQILGAVLSQTCPGQPSCSGRGTCQNSVCTCSEGNALLSVYFAERNNPNLPAATSPCVRLLFQFWFAISLVLVLTHGRRTEKMRYRLNHAISRPFSSFPICLCRFTPTFFNLPLALPRSS